VSVLKVLVVDDEVAVSQVIADVLEHAGHRVERAHSAREFRQIDEEKEFDVYLFDLLLPAANGMDLVRYTRKKCQAGIIILTGNHSEIDVVLGLELGADDYITKPFKPRELCARVRSVARRASMRGEILFEDAVSVPPANDPGAAISYRGWTINRNSRTVRHESGRSLSLTTSEFDVLALLLGNHGRVQTRERILDEIRGTEWAAYDRLVDGLVSRIRKKLDDVEPGGNLIRTIRGVGYIVD